YRKPLLLPWSRQARTEHLRGHFQRKPSYSIVTRCVETEFTRSASLSNVAAGLKWSRALCLTMRLLGHRSRWYGLRARHSIQDSWHGVGVHVRGTKILNQSCFTHCGLERRGDNCRVRRLGGRCHQDRLQHAADRRTCLERQGHFDRISNVERGHKCEGRVAR